MQPYGTQNIALLRLLPRFHGVTWEIMQYVACSEFLGVFHDEVVNNEVV